MFAEEANIKFSSGSGVLLTVCLCSCVVLVHRSCYWIKLQGRGDLRSLDGVQRRALVYSFYHYCQTCVTGVFYYWTPSKPPVSEGISDISELIEIRYSSDSSDRSDSYDINDSIDCSDNSDSMTVFPIVTVLSLVAVVTIVRVMTLVTQNVVL